MTIKIGQCLYRGMEYEPVDPQADSDELAAQGDRLLLYHDRGGEPLMYVAKRGEVNAGWVIGVFTPDDWPGTYGRK